MLKNYTTRIKNRLERSILSTPVRLNSFDSSTELIFNHRLEMYESLQCIRL
ncbi:hypothetical protein Scep_028797 [Stephania cephalantha]|uniref:Uncharacterized protein n=1 Tax=Stephania cephalantha TaxID=152367 RepID=A0AAP0HNS0_9MAGN